MLTVQKICQFGKKLSKATYVKSDLYGNNIRVTLNVRSYSHLQKLAKNMVNRSSSGNISLSLKIVGIICILSFLLDFLFLLFPVQIADKLWQINFARNVVDRGIVPLVGVGILLTAYWIDSTDDRPQALNLKLPTFIFSSILGLFFLLIFPLHLNTVNQVKVQALERVNNESAQLEAQVKTQLDQVQSQLGNDQVKAAVERQRMALKEQLGNQLNELVKDEQRYNQALQNNQLPA